MEAILQAEPRSETGKGPAHRLRAGGRVPAVLYGAGVDATPIHVSALDLLHVFHAMGQASVLVDLKLNGNEYLTIAREIQRDLIHNRFIHIDFMAVNRDEKITVSVELHEVGDSEGVHAGGVIEHHLREVEIECLPSESTTTTYLSGTRCSVWSSDNSRDPFVRITGSPGPLLRTRNAGATSAGLPRAATGCAPRRFPRACGG